MSAIFSLDFYDRVIQPEGTSAQVYYFFVIKIYFIKKMICIVIENDPHKRINQFFFGLRIVVYDRSIL
jgi:hypothetical protein